MFKKLIKLTGVCFILLFSGHAYCASTPEDMLATANLVPPQKRPVDAKKLQEIASFLNEYDPADINANPPEELKISLSELADARALLEETPADENAVSDAKQRLFKIFNDNTSSMMRFNAYQILLSYAAGGCCGSPKADINPEERLNILTQGLKDQDSKVRIWAGITLESVKQGQNRPCPVPEDKPGKTCDPNIERLYNENIKDNPFFKQTFEYMQAFMKLGYDREAILKLTRDFNEVDPGLKFYVLSILSKYEMVFRGDDKTSGAYYSLFLSGIKDNDIWMRFFCFTTLMNTDKYFDTVRKASGVSFNEFFKKMYPADLYLNFYSGNLKIPADVLPANPELVKILKSISDSKVKQAIFFKLLRNSIAGN